MIFYICFEVLLKFGVLSSKHHKTLRKAFLWFLIRKYGLCLVGWAFPLLKNCHAKHKYNFIYKFIFKMAWTDAAIVTVNGTSRKYRFNSTGNVVYSDGISRNIDIDKSKACILFQLSRDKFKPMACDKWRYINTVCRENGKDGEFVLLVSFRSNLSAIFRPIVVFATLRKKNCVCLFSF